MKRILALSLLSCALFIACHPSDEERMQKNKAAHRVPPYGYRGDDTQFIEPTPTPTPAPLVAPEPKTTPPPTAPTPPPPKKETNAYGKPVPGKSGFVTSPYAGPDSGLVDVRGYPPGTPVKDPYTGRVFLVP